MNEWFKSKEFLRYWWNAKSTHSIHSPFVFDFIQNVLHDHRGFYCYEEIEGLRQSLMESDEMITIHDRGAGSQLTTSANRKIKDIAIQVATPVKYAQLLFRIGNYFESRKMLELGTSLGLTSLYFSSVSKEAKVVTIEGDPQLASMASKNFELTGRKNITLLQGAFEEKLPEALKQLEQVDLAYLDGNHRREPTLHYYNSLLPLLHNKSIVIIGDIHWSAEMKKAWAEIISLPQGTVALDLFYVGIIFFQKELSKQDFVLRF